MLMQTNFKSFWALIVLIFGYQITTQAQNVVQRASEQSPKDQVQLGHDEQLIEAQLYLTENDLSNLDKLKLAQTELERNPNNPEQIRAAFNAAARLNAYPIQEKLLNDHAELFEPIDVLWLKHSKAIFLNRVGAQTDDLSQLQQANDLLNEVVTQAPVGSELALLARKDRVDSLVKIRQYRHAIKESDQLMAELPELPLYVKEARADAWSALNHPFKALKIYNQIATTKPIDEQMQQKIINANIDAEYYTRAQQEIEALAHKPKKGDFTGTRLIDNPAYKDLLFSQVRLNALRGNTALARTQINKWLHDAPADPWGLMLKGDIATYQDHYDEAKALYSKAQSLLSPKDQYIVKTKQAEMSLDLGDWRTVVQDVKSLPKDKESVEHVSERLAVEKGAQIIVSAGRPHATHPTDTERETQRDAYLYSHRLEKGHRFFVHTQRVKTPEEGGTLHSGFVGIGAELSLFPVNIKLEFGRGMNINRRGYLWLTGQYHINQHWEAQAAIKLNSDQVLAKALNDKVYGNQYNISAIYTASEWRSAGVWFDALDLSDHNQRLGANIWLRQDLLRHDRWRLNSYTSLDTSKSKKMFTAYYSPYREVAVETELDLSYRQPIDGRISLTSSIVAGAGRYWQSDFSPQTTWVLRARQEWILGPRFSISYEFGRRKSVNDGLADINNYGSLELNMRFK
ncbi:hypothetical protein GCM10009007_04000 [Formosimonas limnophila]|uniref:PgaA membrane beta barrel domain-containing protein n=1 Tax=Formosimonas limnophila TaxID=1384487 RepID=A0A8J3CFY1_9BURK|nr:poly-beta-1,6 N-acetyl-D-glucosamine export porin PgaA [Formosimonas limnophila]GHA66697.1 hypothetical protein GCM10009007_04000 [Formosimonas limnophila]